MIISLRSIALLASLNPTIGVPHAVALRVGALPEGTTR
ncbi:hypothetical protein RG931_003972 [Pseudomonas syringae pv. actinidiae]|uniref:Uncharacterized protein n=1 Tax=Pseudomonas syringae pv. actinidiae TaxID=103796 RepID=A0A2V0Q846_PSESF|nr:hypothetical protein BV361_04178 [Pseudomonas syringae pv. actinidiae]RMS50712.1 hypothetical protein ALP64_204614 [Pseudomonas syringae pv. actinidiae]BBI43179.1 hypothetical protein KPSA1B_101902 [Pseudomonas syringae pv. actinidiae]BBM07274.1 hypothetical protein KPSA3_100968 [Pseudomonas syringae pv. actinidiae]GBH08861.1 hypothetical protein KPSA1_02247 [Pseudomonas syringae pv. actinidiae]